MNHFSPNIQEAWWMIKPRTFGSENHCSTNYHKSKSPVFNDPSGFLKVWGTKFLPWEDFNSWFFWTLGFKNHGLSISYFVQFKYDSPWLFAVPNFHTFRGSFGLNFTHINHFQLDNLKFLYAKYLILLEGLFWRQNHEEFIQCQCYEIWMWWKDWFARCQKI